MELKRSKYVTKAPVNQIFKCGFCEEVVVKPMECHECGTIVCTNCCKGKKCVCGHPFVPLSKSVLKMYNEIEIVCPNPKCGKYIVASQLPDHELKCMLADCANAKLCQAKFTASEFAPACSLRCLLVVLASEIRDQGQLYAKVSGLLKNYVPQAAIVQKKQAVAVGSVISVVGQVVVPKEKVTWKRKAGSVQYVKGDESVVLLMQAGYNYRSAVGSFAMTPGRKYYWQITPLPQTQNQMKIGITDNNFDIETAFSNHALGYAYYGLGQTRHKSNSQGLTYGKPFKKGGVLGVFLDTLKGTLSFCLNGEDMGVAFTDDNLKRHTFYAAVTMMKAAGCKIDYRVALPACYQGKQ